MEKIIYYKDSIMSMDDVKLAKRLFLLYFLSALILIILWFVFHSPLSSSNLLGKLLIAYILCTPLFLNGILGLTINVTIQEPGLTFVKQKAPFRTWISLISGVVVLIIMFVL